MGDNRTGPDHPEAPGGGDQMRTDLAGLNRARFSATYCGRGPHGHVILRDVTGPVGPLQEHIWVRPDHWWGRRLHVTGDRVEFIASVEPYWRNDGSQDLGLFKCKEVRP